MARALAAAVLSQAWKDATQPPFLGTRVVYQDRAWREVKVINVTTEQAVEFLTKPSVVLAFWADVAGTPESAIRQRACKRLQHTRGVLAMARREGAMGA